MYCITSIIDVISLLQMAHFLFSIVNPIVLLSPRKPKQHKEEVKLNCLNVRCWCDVDQLP